MNGLVAVVKMIEALIADDPVHIAFAAGWDYLDAHRDSMARTEEEEAQIALMDLRNYLDGEYEDDDDAE